MDKEFTKTRLFFRNIKSFSHVVPLKTMAKGKHILAINYGNTIKDNLVLEFENDEHRDSWQ